MVWSSSLILYSELGVLWNTCKTRRSCCPILSLGVKSICIIGSQAFTTARDAQIRCIPAMISIKDLVFGRPFGNPSMTTLCWSESCHHTTNTHALWKKYTARNANCSWDISSKTLWPRETHIRTLGGVNECCHCLWSSFPRVSAQGSGRSPTAILFAAADLRDKICLFFVLDHVDRPCVFIAHNRIARMDDGTFWVIGLSLKIRVDSAVQACV